MGIVELQMTWQPSLLSEKRKKGPPLGLRNLGNSCYLNSVLQCLTYTPPLANFCLRSQHSSSCDASASKKPRDCPFCILEAWITRSLTLDLTLDAPSKIQSCLKIFAEHFRFGLQEDAHEFLRYVIDACHNTCLRLKKLRLKGSEGGGREEAVNDNTVVKEIFGGALQSQVKCLGCGGESNKVDEIMDISLDILNSGSLKEAMHKFFQPEVLDGNNKYKCENCKKLMAARKQLSIRQAPNILVVQLKRFEGIFGGKINRPVTFEEVLVLSSFMCKASQDPRPEYSLFGTIVHLGSSPESGHYYAYIKDAMGRWYCCNDSFVSLSTLQEVLSEKVYILFFSLNGKIDFHKTQNITVNGVSKDSIHVDKNEKDMLPLMNRNVIDKSRKVDTAGSEKSQPFALTNGNSMKSDPFVVNGSSRMAVGVEVNNAHFDGCDNSKQKKSEDSSDILEAKQKLEDSCDILGPHRKSEDFCNVLGSKRKWNGSFNFSGLKRKPEASCDILGPNRKPKDSCGNSSLMTKLKDSCVNSEPNEKFRDCCDYSALKKIEDSCDLSMLAGKSCLLLSQDVRSRAEVGNMKEMLKKEASSVLRSCGWYYNVYNFMNLKKQSYALEIGNTLSGNDLEKKLIADAKASFIRQIPKPLKEELIKRIQSFSRRTQEHPIP
ncbi:Ubiquitin carboxyl-terminal hydrolase 25 -like protein [Gossypium arboreum]|uniref:Ubiquitin carboxyl-terminal hydrolase n=1 Tax=Gossypium arboreum TaxID=29729 RepID=A0A0B0P301_GOSAR|nr:Ubiquitin carboxyl-terminal hydrolase 25 -like protein [Gossypium arboreum]